jgi:hypothetical protein
MDGRDAVCNITVTQYRHSVDKADRQDGQLHFRLRARYIGLRYLDITILTPYYPTLCTSMYVG